MPSVRQIRFVWKPILFVLCLLPFTWITVRALELGSLSLGPNPIEAIQDEMGIWGLRLIMMTLAVTPFRHAVGKPWPLQFRRMLGLFAFFYCGMHFLNYLVLDQSLTISAILEDITERPFITIGFASLMLMVPLAVTSTAGWRRKLGQQWNKLHKLVYATAVGGCWHFFWQVKKDITEPMIYIGILAVLLGSRAWRYYRKN